VLIAGGTGQPKRVAVKLASSELYDPATGDLLSNGQPQYWTNRAHRSQAAKRKGIGNRRLGR
jgi:hypothetical protein